jgi:hypothetical protein
MHDPLLAWSLAEVAILVLVSLVSMRHEAELEARRIRREAAETEARIRSAAARARQIMHEEARRHGGM